MGNGQTRHQCVATTRAGSQCTRQAREGHYTCGLKGHQEQEAEAQDVGKDPRDPPAEEIELEYEALARKCLEEMNATAADGVRVQWMRLAIDCVRLLKEERTAALSSGRRPIEVTIGIGPPSKPRPEA